MHQQARATEDASGAVRDVGIIQHQREHDYARDHRDRSDSQ